MPRQTVAPAPTKTYVGIDNGLEGAIAVLTPGATLPVLHELPLRIAGKDKRLDVRAFYTLLHDLGKDKLVVVEQAQKFSPGKMALASTWRVWGALQAVLDLTNAPYVAINPKQWQSRMFSGIRQQDQDTKSASIEVARRIWPNLRLARGGPRATVANDGFADAALIAEYGRRENL